MNISHPNRIEFRVSNDELKILNQRIKESGFNKQQYLHKTIFSNIKILDRKSLQELIVQIRGIAININQIARACNSGHFEFEMERLNASLTAVNKSLEELWRYLRS